MNKSNFVNLGKIILISLIVQIILWIFLANAASVYLGFREHAWFSMTAATIIRFGVGFLLNLVIAFWIIKIAKAENKNPFWWFVLTVFFGLLTVILLYLEMIYSEIKVKNELKR